MEMIWALIGLFVFITIAFMTIAFFFPEWVGITGKKAKAIMAEQDSQTQDKKDN